MSDSNMREQLQNELKRRTERVAQLREMVVNTDAAIKADVQRVNEQLAEKRRQLQAMVDQLNHAAGAAKAVEDLLAALPAEPDIEGTLPAEVEAEA